MDHAMQTTFSYRTRSLSLGFMVLACVFVLALLTGLSAIDDWSVTLFGMVFAFDHVLTLAIFAMAACVFWWTYRQRTIDRAFDVDDNS